MQNGKKKEKRILQHISADYTRENKPWHKLGNIPYSFIFFK